MAVKILMGKHKPTYSPNVVGGDYVVVENCEKMMFSGRKWEQKSYRWHTGWPGGLKKVYAQDMLARQPDSVLQRAIAGMLPKNRLRKRRMHYLRLYAATQPAKALEWRADEAHISRVTGVPKLLPWTPRLRTQAEVDFAAQLDADPEATVSRYGGYEIRVETDPETGDTCFSLVDHNRPDSPNPEHPAAATRKVKYRKVRPNKAMRDQKKEDRLKYLLDRVEQRIKDEQALTTPPS